MSNTVKFDDMKDEQLVERMNDLSEKMRYISQRGRFGQNAYNQLYQYFEETRLALEERRIMEIEGGQESGTVAIIGEDHLHTEKLHPNKDDLKKWGKIKALKDKDDK